MKAQTLRLVMTILLVASAPLAFAHHSTAATFTEERYSTVDGVITEFKFRNPHVLIYIDVTNPDGTVTSWMVEGSSATGWRKANWKNDSLKKGDRLRVSGYATIDGSPMVWLKTMELLDLQTKQLIAKLSDEEDPALALSGKKAEENVEVVASLEFLPAKLSTGEPNFTGTTRREDKLRTWTARGPDGADDPMPYNEKGKVALSAWDLKNDPQVFCDPPGLVRQAGYTSYGQIIHQYPDHVTIEYEEYGAKRAIFFEDKLPRSSVLSHLGDSIARYEGDSLIIESVNLLPNASGHRGKPLSGKISVKEVYTRTDNPELGTVLTTVTTINDPEFLTEPWSIKRFTLYDASYDFIENECVPPKRARPSNVWQDYTQ